MVTVKTNLKQVVGNLKAKLGKLNDPEFMRPVALAMITPLAIRIHKNGIASDGGQIGTYSSSYLKLREKKRGSDTKVIISLTRQLENDYAVVATSKGYGIGFNNAHNYDKSQWVQEHFGKKIFNLTTEEHDLAVGIITDLTNKALQT